MRFMVKRELLGYAIADRIEVASSHVVESFAPWPEHVSKLFVSPYGVSLDQFPVRLGLFPSERTLLFVGQWSYRKGVDILVKAIRDIGSVILVHVGPLVDAPFPRDRNLVHYEPVPQWELKAFYAAAHVFVLPSREDGFGMVLSQALASGLLVVCTDRTGGPVLARSGLGGLIRVVPAGDPEALRRALVDDLEDVVGSPTLLGITEAQREIRAWRRYGSEQLELINGILNDAPVLSLGHGEAVDRLGARPRGKAAPTHQERFRFENRFRPN
jgi:glycosyltransferase involved in cell wall biosynthesis